MEKGENDNRVYSFIWHPRVWVTKVMYCYVVKWPVFCLQRGSAKSPLAPSYFSSLWCILSFFKALCQKWLFCSFELPFYGLYFTIESYNYWTWNDEAWCNLKLQVEQIFYGLDKIKLFGLKTLNQYQLLYWVKNWNCFSGTHGTFLC